ncbi:ADP-ribosylglycohydrolase family protein [Saccharopolyspora gloriosae]|uniref:ADP-ribosylglycohydrolase family protein n=1 Tax=Saccharopolyspora gloriosae TaxID=455344 RepID=UPI001FB8077D|nr:ADP-ribosylglycohydrolase family protein [Saccharopolyspora gloriosae]
MVEQADATELVERWLRSNAEANGEPLDVRVDHEHVSRVPEGWAVPWNTAEFLDGGDLSKSIFPPPVFIVTDPDGALRQANTTPQPGFSTPVAWPGEPQYTEIIDPEYRSMGFYSLGVPNRFVAGWKITLPDGSVQEKVNPGYKIGPERAGMPKSQNPLEALLNFLSMNYIGRDEFLISLLDTVVLVPLDWNSEQPVASGAVMHVYSSPRKIPESCKWLRITVPGFIERFPGSGMSINSDHFPSAHVTALEIAELIAANPGREPGEPRVVSEIGPDGSLDEYARQLQQHFGLEKPPSVPTSWIVGARASGSDLSGEQRQRMLLGLAWATSNPPVTSPRSRPGGRPTSDADLSRDRWPADLHANGLVAVHDDGGRLRPTISTFGTQPRASDSGADFSWHAVTGAFAGFAIGDALGSAVHGLNWDEVRQRFGANGITGLETAFERPGQVSWRTQLLLFLTEGAVRGLRYAGDERFENLPLATRSAHARWLTAQGVPWQQAAGPLATTHPDPGGFLLKVPEMHFRRGLQGGLLAEVQNLVSDPGKENSLNGPIMAMWGLPGAVSTWGAGALATGWKRSPADAAAAGAVSDLFRNLFLRKAFVHPVWSQLEKLLEQYERLDSPESRNIAGLLKHVSTRWKRIFGDDLQDIKELGDGVSTSSVLAQALLIASRHGANPRRALLIAANYTGSAMATALTGALIGARAGVVGLPNDWLEALDIGDLVQEIADDAFWHFSTRNPYNNAYTQEGWIHRYPRW